MNITWQKEKTKAYFQGTCLSNVQILRRVAWLGFIAVLLIAGCATVRENTAQYGQARAKLEGQDVVVGYFKDFRPVQQATPDVCWAACLEQALAFQGVDTDQKRIIEKVHPQADTNAERTINQFWWQQLLSITEERLLDGSEVWARLDMDGGLPRPILSIRTFVRKIARELSLNRIPIVGISTEHGVGHMVTVIGAAYPIDVKRLTTDQIVGFLIYDPLTAKPRLMSATELFKISKALVYITIFNSAVGAATGELSTTLYNY
jgi:hypothetical protein